MQVINLGIRMIVVVIIIHSDHHDRNEYWRFQKTLRKQNCPKMPFLTPPKPQQKYNFSWDPRKFFLYQTTDKYVKIFWSKFVTYSQLGSDWVWWRCVGKCPGDEGSQDEECSTHIATQMVSTGTRGKIHSGVNWFLFTQPPSSRLCLLASNLFSQSKNIARGTTDPVQKNGFQKSNIMSHIQSAR